MAINVINGFPSVPIITGLTGTVRQSNAPEKETASFESIFRKKTEEQGLKVSKHANERLARRNIDLSDEQWMRLESGVKKAGIKGIKESLIMVDDLAFIVNVQNNTVITAVDENEDRVFTNIDGAVIV